VRLRGFAPVLVEQQEPRTATAWPSTTSSIGAARKRRRVGVTRMTANPAAGGGLFSMISAAVVATATGFRPGHHVRGYRENWAYAVNSTSLLGLLTRLRRGASEPTEGRHSASVRFRVHSSRPRLVGPRPSEWARRIPPLPARWPATDSNLP